jgi:hypothetical protein
MVTFLDDSEFDGQLVRTLAAAMRGCADLGEVFATTELVTSGDFDSWHTAWSATAERVRTEADTFLANGDPYNARRAYLRAAEYHRQSFFFARADLDDPRLLSGYDAHVAAFRAAVALLPWATTTMSVEEPLAAAVQGYLFRPDDSGTPRPTVIAPAGYDSTAEAGYSLNAVSALERGMNCLVFEGPGQGGLLYRNRIPLRPDFETVLTPVVDWLLGQQGVDPEGLVLFGRSFAGYLAARAASSEHRLAALVCDPAQYDFAAGIRSRLGQARWDRLQQGDPTLDADLAALVAEPDAENGYRWRMAAHGVSSLSDYFRALAQFTLVNRAAGIRCPTLALAAEGDFASTGQLEIFVDALTAPVITHQFTEAEGAGGHCEGLGQDRLDQVAFGWLAHTLAETRTRRLQHVDG